MSLTTAPGLLERQTELAAIDEAVQSVLAGVGTGVLIEGQPGIGKSGLLAAARSAAASAGLRVLTARAGDLELDFPWGIARQLFEPELARATRTERADLLSDAAALAAPVLVAEQAAGGPAADEFPVLHGLYWLTVNLAQSGPLMLAIDDLQWCDLPSLRFLAYLAVRLESLALLLVSTSRPGEGLPAEARQLVSRLALDDATRVLAPSPLSPEATRTLVQTRLGEGHPEGAFCAACHEMTGGNPFLLGELLAGLLGERVPPLASSVEHVERMTPEVVSRSVLLRLARLPPLALALARAVAVLGGGATALRAARLAGSDPDDASDTLQAVIDADILVGEPSLSFGHPIVRGAVYEDISPLERTRWHERAARLLAGEHAGAAELTAHLLATTPTGSPWIVQQLREAAGDARARGARGTAMACLRRALQEPPPDRPARVAVLRELGDAESAADPRAGCRHLSEALLLAGDPAEKASISLALGAVQAFAGEFSAAVDTVEQALGALDGDDHPLRASLQAELLNAAHWDVATRPRREAILAELDRRSAAGEALDSRLHAQLAIAAVEHGENRPRAIEHARHALNAELPPRPETTTVRHAITVLATCDELRDAEARSVAWLADCQQRGSPLVAALACSVSALVALLAGRVSDGLAFARQALTPREEVWTPPFGVAWLVEALVERGALEEATTELARRGLDGELPQTWPFALLSFCRGRAAHARGDHERALADLLAAGEMTDALGIVNPALMPWRSSAALALIALDRAGEARELADEELDRARGWGAQRPLGVALRAAGLVSRGKDGIELLREAVAVLEESPAPLEHARALTDLGAALRRTGRRVEARELLRRGLDQAHRLGGLALAERARHELLVAGARPRRDALRGRDALTPSELRVARMAAEGATNRHIAQALFVTLRTVELHLTSAYAKLGIRHREQLAGALDERSGGGRESG